MSLDSDPIDQAFPDSGSSPTYKGGDPIDEAFGEVPTASTAADSSALGNVGANLKHLAEGTLETGSSLYHQVLGGYKGLAKLLTTSGDTDAAADTVNAELDKTYKAPKVNEPTLPGGHAAQEIGGGTFADTVPMALHAGAESAGAAGKAGLATTLETLPVALAGLTPRGVEGGEAATTATEEASQAERAALLKRVGLSETRKSVLAGDAQSGANEYQESKLTSPNGTRMKGVLDNERQALSDHADQIVSDTGGTEGSAADEGTRIERGNNILKPLDDLKDHFDQATQKLYAEADKRAEGTPVTLNNFKNVVDDDSEMTNSDRVHLRQGLNSYLAKLKMTGEDGTVSGNVQQAETVRKYLNENWSPQNSRLVGKLKGALDDDVTQSAGDDVYQIARQMRSLRARTLDDPDGISKLMDSSGPEGINRKIPVEKVADAVTSMPVAQLNHVLGTLRNLPPELQESGNTAINEIKAHMASKIADTGQKTSSLWNAKGVTQALSQNSARMQSLFSPEELAKFADLDKAGNILKKDQSYPGAAVQEHNLVRTGAMAAIRGGATAAGAHLGPMGAVAGEYLGGKAAGKINDAALKKNVESRIVQLSSQ
jgi:hypothetical protein